MKKLRSMFAAMLLAGGLAGSSKAAGYTSYDCGMAIVSLWACRTSSYYWVSGGCIDAESDMEMICSLAQWGY
jgi:hypothetical protein